MKSLESFIEAVPVVDKITKQEISAIDWRYVNTIRLHDRFVFVSLIDCHGENGFPGQFFAYMGDEYQIVELYYTLDELHISCQDVETGKLSSIPLSDLYGKCSLVEPPIVQTIPLTPTQAKKLKQELGKSQQINKQLPKLK